MKVNKPKTIIAYHGTTPENAISILQSGVFLPNTWWAFKSEDAFYFGGPIVFQRRFRISEFCDFIKNKIENDTLFDPNDPDPSWQFTAGCKYMKGSMKLGIPNLKGPGSFSR